MGRTLVLILCFLDSSSPIAPQILSLEVVREKDLTEAPKNEKEKIHN
jgi:hypothetical protein